MRGTDEFDRTLPTEEPFVCRPVAEVKGLPDTERWLIESLWAASGVGIVGGTPKTGKTWAVLSLALSVASGLPAFGCYHVPEPGPVLVYPAEDSLAAIRDRLALLCKKRGLSLEGLPLYLLESDRVHLDSVVDRGRLEAALEQHRPKLIVFDPLVRLHSGSESSAQHMAELLGYLRSLERRFSVAIILTHHLAKGRARSSSGQPGQALRGSGDLHAWGDSNLYLTRLGSGTVELRVEHRQAASPEEPLYYRLSIEGSGAELALMDGPPSDEQDNSEVGEEGLRGVVLRPKAKRPLRERILELLDSEQPFSQVALRKALGVRNQALTDALRELETDGQATRPNPAKGWLRVLS